MNDLTPSWNQRLQQRQHALAQQQAAFRGISPQQTQLQQQAAAQSITYYVTGSTAATTSLTSTSTGSTGIFYLGGTGSNIPNPYVSSDVYDTSNFQQNNALTIHDGVEKKIKLPDGTIIDVKKDGSYEIQDKNAKVTYRANRVRDFNCYLNASDLLEAFIRFCGKEVNEITKEDMLNIPIKLFIGWLVLEAAKADKEPEPDIKLIPDLRAWKQSIGDNHETIMGDSTPKMAVLELESA